jgi:hypothetical protein
MTLLGWLNINKSGMLSQAVAKHKEIGKGIFGFLMWKSVEWWYGIYPKI